MSRSDPLDLLRLAFNQKAQKRISVKLKGNELYFDKDVFSLDTQTAWVSSQSNKQFNLGSLWLYLQYHANKAPNKSEYFSKLQALQLDNVSIADGEQIIKYFTGQVNESRCINNQLKITLQNQKLKANDKQSSVQRDGKGDRKQETEMHDEATTKLLSCIEYLNEHQIPTNTKLKSIQYPKSSFHPLFEILEKIKAQYEKQQVPVEQQKQTQIGKKTRLQQIYLKKKLPIIIVPEKTLPGNVSIDNIEKFLLKYEYDQYAKLSNPHVSRIQIIKVLRDRPREFMINSRPELLSVQDWKNVIAVFVIGKQNQFDQWPIKQHKKALQNCLAFLVKFPKNSSGSAANWKCAIKALDPISRNSDKQVVHSIWTDIQNFIFSAPP